jgi:hypothetical protein
MRCEQRTAAAVGMIILVPLFVGGALVAAVCFAIFTSWNIGVPACIGLLMFAVFVGYHASQNYSWVELENGTIRGQKFWSRRLVEQPVSELTRILTAHKVAGSVGESADVLRDGAAALQVGCRGYEFQFREGPKITVGRGDMINVDEFVRAVWQTWQQVSAKKETTR